MINLHIITDPKYGNQTVVWRESNNWWILGTDKQPYLWEVDECTAGAIILKSEGVEL